MSYLDYLENHDLNLLLEDYVLSAYLRKRQKDLEDSRSFHEENFQENNDINKGKHYLISETMEFIKQLEEPTNKDVNKGKHDLISGSFKLEFKGTRWQSMTVGGRIKIYNHMVKYFKW